MFPIIKFDTWFNPRLKLCSRNRNEAISEINPRITLINTFMQPVLEASQLLKVQTTEVGKQLFSFHRYTYDSSFPPFLHGSWLVFVKNHRAKRRNLILICDRNCEHDAVVSQTIELYFSLPFLMVRIRFRGKENDIVANRWQSSHQKVFALELQLGFCLYCRDTRNIFMEIIFTLNKFKRVTI